MPIFIVLLLFISACAGNKQKILKEKKMAAVYVDIKKAEALIEIEREVFSDSLSRAMLYESIFKKHKTTKAVYDSSLVWYGRNLAKMMTVYDFSDRLLTKEKAILSDSLSAHEKMFVRDDSVNIWADSSSVTFSNDLPLQFSYFNIEPSTPFPSGSTFLLSFNSSILGTLHSPVIVKFFVQQPDTIYVQSDTILTDKKVEMYIKTFATRQIQRVYGYLYKKQDLEKENYQFIYFDNIQLIRYNYGSFNLENIPSEELPVDTVLR